MKNMISQDILCCIYITAGIAKKTDDWISVTTYKHQTKVESFFVVDEKL